MRALREREKREERERPKVPVSIRKRGIGPEASETELEDVAEDANTNKFIVASRSQE